MSEMKWRGRVDPPLSRIVSYAMAGALMAAMMTICATTTTRAEYVTLWAMADGMDGGITTLGAGGGNGGGGGGNGGGNSNGGDEDCRCPEKPNPAYDPDHPYPDQQTEPKCIPMEDDELPCWAIEEREPAHEDEDCPECRPVMTIFAECPSKVSQIALYEAKRACEGVSAYRRETVDWQTATICDIEIDYVEVAVVSGLLAAQCFYECSGTAIDEVLDYVICKIRGGDDCGPDDGAFDDCLDCIEGFLDGCRIVKECVESDQQFVIPNWTDVANGGPCP